MVNVRLANNLTPSELASWPYSLSPASSRSEVLKETDCGSMSAYISFDTTTYSPAQKQTVE